MSVLALRRIPSEILVQILETVGKSICQDLMTIDFHRGAKSSNAIPYGRHLNQFLQVGLVCKLFHRFLTDYVRVHGLPIRERLMDLQMLKFANFLESVKIIQHHLRVQEESGCRCCNRNRLRDLVHVVANRRKSSFVDLVPVKSRK